VSIDVAKTYDCPNDGVPKKERRLHPRGPKNERTEHLFDGFRNAIENASDYWRGYLRAMRDDFASFARAGAPTHPAEPAPHAAQGVPLSSTYKVQIGQQCPHPRAAITIGPTTDQQNHYCPDCHTSWTTWPAWQRAAELAAPAAQSAETLTDKQIVAGCAAWERAYHKGLSDAICVAEFRAAIAAQRGE
jgi:hypothetical protein